MANKLYNIKTDVVPSDVIYIGRGSSYGNPFEIGKDGTRNEVCDKYEQYVKDNKKLLFKIKTELKGKDLFCFCSPKRCHGDFLLRIANEEESGLNGLF